MSATLHVGLRSIVSILWNGWSNKEGKSCFVYGIKSSNNR